MNLLAWGTVASLTSEVGPRALKYAGGHQDVEVHPESSPAARILRARERECGARWGGLGSTAASFLSKLDSCLGRGGWQAGASGPQQEASRVWGWQ